VTELMFIDSSYTNFATVASNGAEGALDFTPWELRSKSRATLPLTSLSAFLSS